MEAIRSVLTFIIKLHLPLVLRNLRFSIFLIIFLLLFLPKKSDEKLNTKGSLSNLSACNLPSDFKTISYHSALGERNPFPNNLHTVLVSIVNPQGTVTTITNNSIQLDESYSSDHFIHENFDETMFRPVVTVVSDYEQQQFADTESETEHASKVVDMPSELIVPVIDEAMLKQRKRERQNEAQQFVIKAQETARQQQVTPVTVKDTPKEEKEELQPVKENEKVVEGVAENVTVDKPEESPQVYQKRGKKGQRNKKYEEKKSADKNRKEQVEPEKKIVKVPAIDKIQPIPETVKKPSVEKALLASVFPKFVKEPSAETILPIAESAKASKEPSVERTLPALASSKVSSKEPSVERAWAVPRSYKASKEPSVERASSVPASPKFSKEASVERALPVSASPRISKEPSVDRITPEEPDYAVLNEALSKLILETESDETTDVVDEEPAEPILAPIEIEIPIKEEIILASKAPEKKPENNGRRGKRSKKFDSDANKTSPKGDAIDGFPPLIATCSLVIAHKSPSIPPPALVSISPIEEIIKPEIIGDDEIEIIPHNNNVEVDACFDHNMDAHLVDESLIQSQDFTKQDFIKNEDFYDIDDELPPLEPLEPFEPFDTTTEKETLSDSYYAKEKMKSKMSELLKDTNMIFAMCSSLKEMKDDDDFASTDSSQIQRSTSSSLTTNTTTATFASANSNQSLEGQDDKSLESEVEESSPTELFVEAEMKASSEPEKEVEETSEFEATSSETDDSSKKSSSLEENFKREDDEELRPLLQASVTSLSPSASSFAAITTNTTEANISMTLPETNQKLLPSSQPIASNTGNGNKRKNKKKRK